jgi:mannan endo-1,4-beta-mannosidase
MRSSLKIVLGIVLLLALITFLFVLIVKQDATKKTIPSWQNLTYRNMSQERQMVLSYLTNLPDEKKVLSGQNIGHANVQLAKGYDRFFTIDGKHPAILAVDYGWEDLDPEKIHEANQIIIKHWQQGGLVTISMHPSNPWTGGGVRDMDLDGAFYLDILHNETDAHARWMQDLDTVAAGLQELQDAGVIVLWRPLHEMNGDWFWWSAGENGRATPEEFNEVWKNMHAYFSEEKKLDNLLWVYGPFNQGGNPLIKPVNLYYPGAEYVDIVALDYYRNSFDQLDESYDEIITLGKPLGFGEVGPANYASANPHGKWDSTLLIRDIREQHPLFSYFVFWHSYGNMQMALIDNENAGQLLNDSSVVNLGDVEW